VRVAGCVLIALGALGSGGLLVDAIRQGVEEDRMGGIVVGLLIAAMGATIVALT
jgi:hypothetical protein